MAITAAAAAAVAAATSTPKTFLSSQNTPSLLPTPHLRFPTHPSSFPNYPTPPLKTRSRSTPKPLLTPRATVTASSPSPTTFNGPCYVLGDNIDTDQIIPAEHLTLVPSNPEEYLKLGSLALIGLPAANCPIPFVDPTESSTRFRVIIAGANFGCGSSREHAPVALGAAGAKVVVAESFARIFFRNSVATGEIYPLESEGVGLSKECSTGDIVTVDLAGSRLINHTTGKEYPLKPIGDAGPVIEAGGIFAYARKTEHLTQSNPSQQDVL